jgi:hypothetical protein
VWFGNPILYSFIYLEKGLIMRFSRIFSFLTIFVSSMTYAQTNALVVFRHAEDFKGGSENWEKDCSAQITAEESQNLGISCDGKKWQYNSFRDPEVQPVSIPWRRLSPAGRTQAQKIADRLPAWLDANGYSPVNRVVTKDPRPYDHTTTNPFQTVAPLVLTLDTDERDYLPGRNFVRLKFLMDVSNDELTKGALFDGTEFSTVLSWDAEGLWGKTCCDNNGESYYPSKMLSSSIFSRLLTDDDILYIESETGKPHKAKEIYILVYDEELKKFVVDDIVDLDEM